MFTQADVNMITAQLPTEAIMQIHKATKISRPTIYKFLQGKKIRSKCQERIYLCALKIIERNKLKKKEIKKQRTRILNIN